MQYSDAVNFFMMLSFGLIAIYATMMVDFRAPENVWKRRCVLITAVLIILNSFLRMVFGGDGYQYIAIFLLTVPYTILILAASRHRGLHLLFNVCTCIWLGSTVDAVGVFLQVLMPELGWIRMATRFVGFAALYFVVRAFRPHYLNMLHTLDKGWGMLCIPPAFAILVLVFINNELLPLRPLPAAVAILGVSAICTSTYILIFRFLSNLLREKELESGRDLMNVQIQAMRKQMETTRDAEEAMKIQRHDMRHKLITLSSLIGKGENDAALELIGREQMMLEELSARRWCQNDILNAMFTYYFELAEKKKIKLETSLEISDNIPVDAVELSMVFANALENAVRACEEVPAGNRKIVCRCVERPCLMLQVENTCAKGVAFDGSGMPVAEKEGHGTGSRSIAAFCRKYGAFYQYRLENGWFRLRISL